MLPFIRMLALGCTLVTVTAAMAQGDAEDLDYSLFGDVLVDDPEAAGEAPFHLLRVPTASAIPLQLDGGVGFTWAQGDPVMHANIKLRRQHRLEVGARIDADPDEVGVAGAVVGLRHQIHKYLAWGINATARDGAGGGKDDAGGSFVFMVRKRNWMGTPLGIKSRLGAGLGDAISTDGVGLRGMAEADWVASPRLTVLAGVKGRSVSDDFSGHVGVDGWLAARGMVTERISLRLSAGLGLMGDAQQQDPSASVFLVFEPR